MKIRLLIILMLLALFLFKNDYSFAKINTQQQIMITSTPIDSDDSDIIGFDNVDNLQLLYDISFDECISNLRDIVWLSDSTSIAIACDKVIYLYSILDREVYHIFSDHSGTIFNLDYTIDKNYLASTSQDNSIIVYDLNSLNILWKYEDKNRPQSAFFTDLKFNSTGNLLAAVTEEEEKALYVWDVLSQEIVYYFQNQIPMYSLAFFSIGNVLLIPGNDSDIWLHDVIDENKEKFELPISFEMVTDINNIKINYNDKIISISYSNYGIVIYHLDNNMIEHIKLKIDMTNRGLDYHPNNNLLALADDKNNISLWDSDPLIQLTILEGHKSFIWSIEFSNDGKLLASSSIEGNIKIWGIVQDK